MNAYRRNVLAVVQDLLAPLGQVERALDFGAGDGWFAAELTRAKVFAAVSAVDVQLRDKVFVTPTLYDGHRLPFCDREFDLAYAIDVLHHAPNPRSALTEVLRCTRRHFIIKDHTYSTALGYLTLCVLDELGNRRFHIPSRYKYQREWEWFTWLAEGGFKLVRLIHPVVCHKGALGMTNGLQFAAHFERAGT
jgi:SAM-dependent methyltransferase